MNCSKQLDLLRNYARFYVGIMMLCCPLASFGASLENMNLCRHIQLSPTDAIAENPDSERITLFGNSVHSLGKDQFSVEGDVLMQQGGHTLNAKKLTYNLSNNYIDSVCPA